MPRHVRTDADVLRQEARAIELLASDIEVPPDRIQEYWAISAELINLVSDIDELTQRFENSGSDEEVLQLRRRSRSIAASLIELSAPKDR